MPAESMHSQRPLGSNYRTFDWPHEQNCARQCDQYRQTGKGPHIEPFPGHQKHHGTDNEMAYDKNIEIGWQVVSSMVVKRRSAFATRPYRGEQAGKQAIAAAIRASSTCAAKHRPKKRAFCVRMIRWIGVGHHNSTLIMPTRAVASPLLSGADREFTGPFIAGSCARNGTERNTLA